MNSRLATVTAGTVMSFTGVGFLAGGPAQAASAVPQFASVPLSSSLTSVPEVASGAAPGGSTVVLFVEPPTSVFAAHKSFTLTPVSRSRVTHGRWQLRLPAIAHEYLEPTGSANFEVMKFTPTGTAVTFFGEEDLKHPVARTLTQWKAIVSKPAATSKPDVCYSTYDKSLGHQKTLIGETFASDRRATLNFTYSTGASSSLGVAVSDTADNSGFSQSGTETSSSTASDDFNAVVGAYNEYYDAYFGHALYAISCDYGKVSQVYYQSENTGWTTGAAQDAVISAPYNAQDCAPEPSRGFTVKVNKSDAINWSNGFTLEGIGLSAQTGYATNAEVDTTWPANYNTKFSNRNCGVHAWPGQKGSLIAVARGV